MLVSGPIWRKPGYKKGKLDTFFETPFDFSLMKKRCKKFAIIHGDDDPFVPLDHAIQFAEMLAAPLAVIKQGKHLNGASGHHELPSILTTLRAIMEKRKRP